MLQISENIFFIHILTIWHLSDNYRPSIFLQSIYLPIVLPGIKKETQPGAAAVHDFSFKYALEARKKDPAVAIIRFQMVMQAGLCHDQAEPVEVQYCHLPTVGVVR